VIPFLRDAFGELAAERRQKRFPAGEIDIFLVGDNEFIFDEGCFDYLGTSFTNKGNLFSNFCSKLEEYKSGLVPSSRV